MIAPTMRGRRGFTVLGYDPSGAIRTRHIFGVVDVLGPGSQKLIPPTPHPSDLLFKWLASPLSGNAAESLQIIAPDIADRLALALDPYGARPHSMLTKRRAMTSVSANLSEQEREHHRRYAEAILARELRTLGAMSSSSGRNRELFRLVCRVGRWVHAGILPAERFTANLLEACRVNSLVEEDGVRSVLATIESGLRKSAGDFLPELGGRSHG